MGRLGLLVYFWPCISKTAEEISNKFGITDRQFTYPNSLATYNRVLLGKLTDPQPVRNFPYFMEPEFSLVFKTVRQLSLL